ncbi:JAB domain-containing protein [Sphingomonas sp. SUN019]|uniref:JAB domain-containing protein n=1 Tax=Sphingomonas sp. SUN019 TaxID=2937788 RepID=UPI002164470A|nr:JAB domain-containing protein [Sphingomonas sp. SUN019]UVO51669.1 JAB domain-containing protein [Sphingomonas sp. SUN019]
MSETSFAHLFAPIAVVGMEVVVFAFLDSHGRLLGMRHIPSARFASVNVPIRLVATDALAFDARAVVMAHNHPSGDPEPSTQDLRVTRGIATAFDALGIRLIDHLVLAGDVVTSFRGRGLL